MQSLNLRDTSQLLQEIRSRPKSKDEATREGEPSLGGMHQRKLSKYTKISSQVICVTPICKLQIKSHQQASKKVSAKGMNKLDRVSANLTTHILIIIMG